MGVLGDLRSLGGRSQAPFDPRVRPFAAGLAAEKPAANLVRSDRYGGTFYYETDTGTVWYSNGSTWTQVTGANSYDRDNTTVDVVSSATETIVYARTIAGGTLGTNRVARLSLNGDFLNNTGGFQQIIIRVKLGGTTLYDSNTSSSIDASASRRAWRMVFEVGNLQASNSQFMSGNFSMSRAGSATTGIGSIGVALDALDSGYGMNGTSSIDTSVDRTLEVTVQNSANSANMSFRKRLGVLELL